MRASGTGEAPLCGGKPISRRAGCLGSIYLSEFQNNEGYLISRYIYSTWVMFLKTGILKYGRIRDLRNDRGLTQAEIAEILKVKQNTYCQYETGTLNYPVDVVVTLAEYYGVSVDYLLGLTDERKPYPRKRKQP